MNCGHSVAAQYLSAVVIRRKHDMDRNDNALLQQ